MNTEKLNMWITLLANLGVFTGIILLVYELGQNRQLMRAEIRNDLSTTAVNFLHSLAENPVLAEAILKANAGAELTPSEAYRVGSRSESVFRFWENSHYQYRQGLYDEIEFAASLETMRLIIGQNEYLEKYWCQNKLLFSVPFGQQIDEYLTRGYC